MLCQEWASLTQPSELVTFGLEVAPKEKGVGHPWMAEWAYVQSLRVTETTICVTETTKQEVQQLIKTFEEKIATKTSLKQAGVTLKHQHKPLSDRQNTQLGIVKKELDDATVKLKRFLRDAERIAQRERWYERIETRKSFLLISADSRVQSMAPLHQSRRLKPIEGHGSVALALTHYFLTFRNSLLQQRRGRLTTWRTKTRWYAQWVGW